jgi:hypothetical protein
MVRSDIRCGAIAVSVDPPTISRREKQTVQDERELVERGYVLRTGRRTPMVSRRFLCWDGEGATDANNDHHYILFGHSDGTYVKGWSLGSSDCLSFLIQQAIIHPDCIHFGFAFSYDVNMILRDLPVERLDRLWETGTCYHGRYRLEYMPKRWFMVTDRKQQVTIKIFDVWSYFGCSALKAWGQYLPDEDLTFVTEGKNRRSSVTYADLDSLVIPYWRKEGKLYVQLMERLRDYMITANLRVSSWHGTGSIATVLLRRHKFTRVQSPEEVTVAAQYAYFGGRFERFRAGLYEGPIYSYDVRSAFPYGLSQCPDLKNGEWHHVNGEDCDPSSFPFSLYYVSYLDENQHDSRFRNCHAMVQPFPHRDVRGTVRFPFRREGWLWGIEVAAALRVYDNSIRIMEGWVFQPGSDISPFAFIVDIYNQRAEWKRQGNPAQFALKIGLNSIYGKVAQKVGSKNGEPPKFHQLEYAGYATAYCRAMMLDAIGDAYLHIDSINADGIISTEPLNVTIGEGLGEWEEERYDGVLGIQSGIYWLRQDGKWVKERIRGISVGDVNVQDALDALKNLDTLTSRTTRFIGMGRGRGKPDIFTKWLESFPKYEWGGSGKRIHDPTHCRACVNDGQYHDTFMPEPYQGESMPHPLPWTHTGAERVRDDDTWS